MAIAQGCRVSSNFVGDVRRIIHPINDSSAGSPDVLATRTVTRNGKTYEQKVKACGVSHTFDKVRGSLATAASDAPAPDLATRDRII